MGALLLCSEGDFGGGGGQQAPRTGLLTNGRMLWDGVCVCVCVCGEAAWGLSLISKSM